MKNIRIFWVDALRGLAIILMLIFHIAFDLDMFGIYKIGLYSGFWGALARFTQFTFLILVGFSMYLSYRNRKPYGKFLKRQIFRAVKLLAIAFCITLATLIAYPEGYIRFGVLHLISLGIAAGALIIPYPRFNLLLIFLCLIAGMIAPGIHANTELFLLFGVTPYGFYTIDYFPIFPWLTLILLGISLARITNIKKLITHNKHIPGLGFLETAGRHSLFIYLVHQPILIGIIWLLSISNVLK